MHLAVFEPRTFTLQTAGTYFRELVVRLEGGGALLCHKECLELAHDLVIELQLFSCTRKVARLEKKKKKKYI